MANAGVGKASTAKIGRFDWTTVKGTTVLLSLVGAYVILVPTLSFIPSLGPFNEKRVLQIGVLVAFAGGLLVSRSIRRRWLTTFYSLPRLARWGLSGVLGLGLLSSALSPAPFYAVLEVGHFLLLFVAAGVVASEIRRAPTWTQRVLLGMVGVSGALYAVYFGMGYGVQLAMGNSKLWPDAATNFGNIRFFNHYQTWTIPLLAGILLAVPRKLRMLRGSLFAIAALWWALVLASGVRGTIVGMVVAAVGVALLFRRRAHRWLLVQGAALLAGVALFYLLFSIGDASVGAPPSAERFGEGSSGRLQYWRVCLEMLGAHPWLGAGPMHFAWPPYQFTEPASPHSALMQWLAEWGLPSTLIMAGFVVWGGWRYMLQEREQFEDSTNIIGIAVVASLLAGAAHSLVSGIMLAPLSQMCLVLVVGWAWGRYQPSNRTEDADPSLRALAVLCALLLGSMVVVGSSLTDLSVTEERRSAFEKSADHRNRFAPRYWAQGYIGVRDSSVMERARRDR